MATRDATLGGAATDQGSPFGGGNTNTSLMGPSATMGYQVKLGNGQTIMLGSEADYLKLKEFQSGQQQATVPTLGGGGGSGGGGLGSTLDLAAEGFQTVTGFLAGSNYNSKLQDYQDARNNLLDTRDALVQHRTASTDPALVDLVLKGVDAQLDTMDSAISVLNTQITAVDMFAGGSAAKVVSRFVDTGGSVGGMGSGGLGTVAAVGAAGLGLGLILRNNNNTTTTRRRSR